MTKKDRGEYLSHVQAPLFGSRHCGLLRGLPSVVNHVCSAASHILNPQYHFGGLGCAVREAIRRVIPFVPNQQGWLPLATIQSQIAEVLIHSLASDQALRKTFELVATKGPAQKDFDALFAALDADLRNALDGVRDMPNQPLEDEPQRVRDELQTLSANHRQG